MPHDYAIKGDLETAVDPDLRLSNRLDVVDADKLLTQRGRQLRRESNHYNYRQANQWPMVHQQFLTDMRNLFTVHRAGADVIERWRKRR